MNLLDEPLPKREAPPLTSASEPLLVRRGSLTTPAKVTLGLGTTAAYLVHLAYKNSWLKAYDFVRLKRHAKLTQGLIILSAFGLVFNPAEQYIWTKVSSQVHFWQSLRLRGLNSVKQS
jgi:hypothetical protein